MNTILCVDPGASGGVVLRGIDGTVNAVKMPDTEGDILSLIEQATNRSQPGYCIAIVEEVSGFAGVGHPGSAMFNFGRNFGFILGCLQALAWRVELVRPQTWQKAIGVPVTGRQKAPKGASDEEKKRVKAANSVAKLEHKRTLKGMAQRLYPDLKVTLANCDALLLLEYHKRCQSSSVAERADVRGAGATPASGFQL